jgi:hypothetical protein
LGISTFHRSIHVVALDLIGPAVADAIGVDERNASLERLRNAPGVVGEHVQSERLTDTAHLLDASGEVARQHLVDDLDGAVVADQYAVAFAQIAGRCRDDGAVDPRAELAVTIVGA